jgi:hypothetical protein
MSLPANSAMYNQIVCNTKINIKITKTLKNVLTKEINMYLSSIFTPRG